MKREIAVVAAGLVLFAFGIIPASAQQSPPTNPGTPGETQAMPGHGMGGMSGGDRMMCPMMMGMMDTRTDPRAMQMHGEMMKAMGDIMMKYGKMQEGSTTR